MSSRKLTARETVEQIRNQARKHRLEQAQSLSNEEAEQQLRAEGIDVDAGRAKLDAEIARASGAKPEEKVVSLDAERAKRMARLGKFAWIANGVGLSMAAATVMYLGNTGVLVAIFAPQVTGPIAPVTAGNVPPTSDDPYRRSALAECKADHHERCLKLLDAAKVLDPDGDQSPPVQTARARAARALAAKDGGD